jgi:hypothetical protein
MKRRILSATLVTSVLGFALSTSAQLSWSAYDTTGNLVNGNAGSGGDIGNGSVSLTVGAGQQLIFVTQNFTPINLSSPNTTATVNFNLSISGGLTGANLFGNPRVLGVGLFNTAGSAGTSDDKGYFSLWNAGGPYPEIYTHTTGAQQGQGGNYTGTLVDATTYASLIRIRSNGTGSIGLGSGSSLAAAGIAFQGTSPTVDQRAYINPTAPPGGYTSFDEFAIMFHNQTGDEITVNLDSIGLTPASVPEPSSFALASLGLLGLLIRRNRN